jgi:hypothetical protein
MYFDKLFRDFKAIQFQSQKVLSAQQLNNEELANFAGNVECLKKELQELQFADEIDVHIDAIQLIDLNFEPKSFFGIGLLNAMTFGWFKKFRSKRKKLIYFKSSAKRLVQQFSHLEMLIKKL